MKRNILLLTAVVLAAVLLSGCTLWPTFLSKNVKVTYTFDTETKAIFNEKDATKKLAKEAVDAEIKIPFAKDKSIELENLEITVKSGEEDFDKQEIKFEADGEIGLKTGKFVVGKKDIKVTVKKKAVN